MKLDDHALEDLACRIKPLRASTEGILYHVEPVGLHAPFNKSALTDRAKGLIAIASVPTAHVGSRYKPQPCPKLRQSFEPTMAEVLRQASPDILQQATAFRTYLTREQERAAVFGEVPVATTVFYAPLRQQR